MSIKVCGLLELNDHEIQANKKIQLSFLVVEKAISHKIWIKFGELVFTGFMKKCVQSSWIIPFELVDYPMDVNAELLFTGDGIEMLSRGLRIDTGECLSSRMMRVQNFLKNLLATKFIDKIVLDVNAIDIDEDSVEIIEIKVNDFCKKMIELYEREDNWTPTIRILVREH